MRVSTLLALVWGLGLLGFSSWRAVLPNNRDQAGLDFFVVETDGVEHALPKDTHLYDDALSRVTAHNFAQDGFWRTRGLPNRRGAPRVSLYDFTGTQCEPLAEQPAPLLEWNGFGQPVAVASASNDCVHIHYPPLADWTFGGLARLGLKRVLCYKLLAIFLNLAGLALFFCWLTREVRAGAALVGCGLASVLPASLAWADALYFHSFQFLFLSAGILSFSEYLLKQRRRWLGVTFVCFLCEALVSYQLILCFGIVLVGLQRLQPRATRIALSRLAILAFAPVLGLILQLTLATSSFGARRVAANLTRTLADRVLHGAPNGFSALLAALDASSPLLLLGLSLLAVVLERVTRPAERRRPLLLLLLFFLAGISFILVFPGTAAWHASSLHRLLLPFVMLLFAFAAESCAAALLALRVATAGRARALAGICVLLSLAPLGWAALRGVRQVRREIAWNLLRNRRPDPENLALRSLDALYWTAGVPRSRGLLLMPVSGLRTYEPPAWLTDLRMLGPLPFHYEVWWLDAQPFRTVQMLVDRAQAAELVEHCELGLLEARQFSSPAESPRATVVDFVPDAREPAPRAPYAWLRFSLPQARSTRALRLSCSGLESVALHQFEAFSTVVSP